MYNALQKTILKLSNEFLLEAKSSPHLLADMASMESYMSESYGERVFVEMLQNADDAKATSFYVYESTGHIFIANNGQKFNDKDVISICRSGASEKRRGDTIGYRGVGFKSTTHLSNQIYIHSNDCTFTFSKSLAAEKLGGIKESEVPTIRIPFLVNKLDREIDEVLNNLKQRGFTTIFVFCNAEILTLLQEVNSVKGDYFLFLRHVRNVNIDVSGNRIVGKVRRSHHNTEIQLNDKKSLWKIIKNKDTQIALALNEKHEIIPCRKEEAIFHCYLPTYEPSPFLFKINSDFSTDPSRKHITLDERTEEALSTSANLLFEDIKQRIYSNDQDLAQLIRVIMQKNTFAKIAQSFENKFQYLVQTSWLQMQNGNLIAPKDYIKKSNFLNDAEWNWIRQNSPLKGTLPNVNEEALIILDEYMGRYAKESYSTNDWILMISEIDFINKIPNLILLKLYTNLIKQIRNKMLITNEKFNISGCYFKYNNKLIRFSEATKEELYMFLLEIKSQLISGEIEWFIKIYNLEANQRNDSIDSKMNLPNFRIKETHVTNSENIQVMENKSSYIKKPITRWRAAENQCVEFEEMQGHKARDVSKQNLGYDIVSSTPDHQERYIEVKSVKNRGAKISMTNNEYTAAHIYGDNYFLCVIYEENADVIFEYIQNPLENLVLEKVVRQWEWSCEDYKGNVFKVSTE